MPWERRTYRGNKVWVLFDEEGRPDLDDRGLARMRYKPDDERTYTVRPAEVGPVPEPGPEGDSGPRLPIEVFAEAWTTDEATGIATVLVWQGRTREVVRRGRPMPRPRAGVAAVVLGLEAVRRRTYPVRVYTDHLEALHALRASGTANDRGGLAERLRAACRRFKDLRLLRPDPEAASPHRARARVLAEREATRPP